ncbi:rhodopsin [Aulostomus maculatus]
MDAEELIESIIRAFMFLAGILGNNCLAIRSIPEKKSVIRTNEILFINLAISNLITNYLVDLPDTMADFAGRWFLGETYCGVFRFCADLSETSSIYTTFFISAYWHQKLVGSLKYGGAPVRLDSLRLVACLLAGSWTVAVVFSIPHFFFVTVGGDNGSHEDCIDVFPSMFVRQIYESFYLTLANALPLAGTVFASVQIVITLLQNQRRVRGQKSDPTKEVVKEKDLGNRNDREVSVSETADSASVVYSPPPPPLPSSCPDAAHSSPLNAKKDPDSKLGTSTSLSKPGQVTAKSSSNTQVRAAKSVVAVAGIFLVCWLTHLFLRITNNIHTSSLVVEVASYIAASYTCIIPYIFLHGVKKLYCSCKK